MKPAARLTAQALPRLFLSGRGSSVAIPSVVASRAIHSSSAVPADVAPFCATGPPPEPPQPAVEHPYAKIERRRKQAELLKNAKEARDAANGKTSSGKSLKKRFWKDVHVKEVNGAYQVHLDSRPLRHPATKEIVNIPLSKPYLAHALALEWDLITTPQQALKQHLIPLTSIVCRALDIADDDAGHATSSSSANTGTSAPIRTTVATMLLRYLDTDSLLCWAPPPNEPPAEGEPTLRELQERTAVDIIGYLSTHIWPGIEIEPVLDGSSFLPKEQKEGVREVIQGWILGLNEWELVGLERATLASKSLLGAVRLVVEWSEGAAGQPGRKLSAATDGGKAQQEGERRRFGVEEAARAASLEVEWQTRKWGEVEDTHDVEKEDVRRQLGSVVLVTAGTGSW